MPTPVLIRIYANHSLYRAQCPGDALPDYVFEPIMANGTSPIVAFLHRLVGSGTAAAVAITNTNTPSVSTCLSFDFMSASFFPLRGTEGASHPLLCWLC